MLWYCKRFRSTGMKVSVKAVGHPIRKPGDGERPARKVLRIEHAGKTLLTFNIEADAYQPTFALRSGS